VLASTGFVALACEVAWTRALGILTGTTLYGFSAILAAFLTGIALGSWAARGRLARLPDPRTALAAGLVLLGAALLATRAGLAGLPALQAYARTLDAGPGAQNLVRYGAVFLLLLPPTFLFGALYPLSLRLCCGDAAGVRSALGRAFAVNTFASILGAVATGAWLIPWLGTDGVQVALALAILATPLALLLRPLRARTALRVLAPAAALAAAAPFLPGLDLEGVIRSVHYERGERASEGRFLYLGEGRTGVVSVVSYDERTAEIQNNGLKEALVDRQNPRFGPAIEGLLGALPYLLHPAPRSAFVVGFGGGTTVQTLAFTDLERIRVVELEPRIVDAVRLLHGGAIPCLQDARVELSFDDARSRLLLEDKRYDLIVSQPSHPWLAGAGNLFTHEFFRLEHSRLAPGGVCAQWVNLFRMERDVLRSIVGTFYGVFPQGFVCCSALTGDLILIGSDAAPRLSGARFRDALADHPDLEHFLELQDLGHAGDLLWYFYCGRDEALELAGDATPNTDLNLFSEVRLAALGLDPGPEASPAALIQQHYKPDPRPYLDPADAARTLAEGGRFFVRFDALGQAHVIEAMLREMGDAYGAQQLAQAIRERMVQTGAGGQPATGALPGPASK
jgi:spermidine synthase